MAAHVSPPSAVTPDAVSPTGGARAAATASVLRRLALVPHNAAPHTGVVEDSHQRQTAAQRGRSACVCVVNFSTVPCCRVGAISDKRTAKRNNIPTSDGPRAGMSGPGAVTKSGTTPSSPAPKAIVTFAGTSQSKQSSDQGRAATGLDIAAIEANASTGGMPLINIVSPEPTVRLMKPLESAYRVSQTESLIYRIANEVQQVRRLFAAIAARDGVIDAQEAAANERLIEIEEQLEAKADDERAAIALIRTGRSKRTRGIVGDLFRNEAA